MGIQHFCRRIDWLLHLRSDRFLLEEKVKFSDKAKALVKERAQGNCELCGLQASEPQYHHRRPRGMGGTRRKESGDPANALYLHFKCHERVERNRLEALHNGWLIRQSDEPTLVPVFRRGEWVILHPDGRLSIINVTLDDSSLPE